MQENDKPQIQNKGFLLGRKNYSFIEKTYKAGIHLILHFPLYDTGRGKAELCPQYVYLLKRTS